MKNKKVFLFDPVYHHYMDCIPFMDRNIPFEIVFTQKPLSLLLNLLQKFNLNNFSLYDPNTFICNKDDILVACTDESTHLIHKLQKKFATNLQDESKSEIHFRSKLYYTDAKKFSWNNIYDQIEYPCVAKPEFSPSGSINVFFLHNHRDVNKLTNYRLEDFIFQPYYHGTEYSVDIISKNGNHHLIGIWKYEKVKEFSPVVSSVNLIKDIQLENKIFPVIKRVLDDIGRINGASHIEVFHEGNEIKICEINFRFHGGASSKAYSMGTGLSHQDAFIDCLYYDQIIPSTYKKYKSIGKFFCNLERVISKDSVDFDFFMHLESVIETYAQPGNDAYTFNKTVDRNTNFFKYLSDMDHPSFHADQLQVKKWLYKLNYA